MEWCGIIAFIQAASPTVAWLRARNSPSTNRAPAPAKIARLARRSSYMLSIHASMTTAIIEPMKTAIHSRVWLNQTSDHR